MTITDSQTSFIAPTARRTASQYLMDLLRSGIAAYVRHYAPVVGSTTVDASSQLRWVPVR